MVTFFITFTNGFFFIFLIKNETHFVTFFIFFSHRFFTSMRADSSTRWLFTASISPSWSRCLSFSASTYWRSGFVSTCSSVGCRGRPTWPSTWPLTSTVMTTEAGCCVEPSSVISVSPWWLPWPPSHRKSRNDFRLLTTSETPVSDSKHPTTVRVKKAFPRGFLTLFPNFPNGWEFLV